MQQGVFTIIALKAPNLPAPHTRDACRSCGHTRGYLARYIKTNGSVAVRWVCDRCEDYKTAGDLPQTLLLGRVPAVAVEDLPLRVDHSDDPSLWPPCVVCDSTSEENHHWAPRAIFPDWPDLVIPLCLKHHDEWHHRMRANGLRWPHELQEVM